LSRLRVLLPLAAAFLLSGAAAAQDLREQLTDFFRTGVTLAPPTVPGQPTHEAHFDSVTGQFAAVDQFYAEITQQLAAFPLPSSSGGFTYRYDPGLGTFVRAADSFGPIYAERAQTIGKGFLNLGVNYSHFSYDMISDLDLDSDEIPVLFLHLPSADPTDPQHFTPWFRGDAITGPLNLKVTSDITAFVATYGVTNRFDIGVAVPLVNVSVDQASTLTIERFATGGNISTIHRFDPDGDPDCAVATGGDVESCTQVGSATGLGDVLFRAKYRLTDSPRGGFALATDARFPTGNEDDLLGTGVFQIRAFLIGSVQLGTFSPHINAGYTWAIHRHNNQPAGSPGVPDEINYTAGFDWALGSRVTFAGDVIGRTFRNSQVVGVELTPLCVNPNPAYVPPAGSTCANDANLVSYVRPQIAVTTGNVNTLIGSAGFKINPVGNLLVTLNALFSITKEGLQDKFTPVVGIDYAF
jgi:hypothetical protein